MTYLALILSVLIGLLIVFGLKPGKKSTQLLLSFSGAYLLSITVLHLLPEAYTSLSESIGLFVLLGLLIQLILDYFSKGAEHGHMHARMDNTMPWALIISLCIHAFMEGIPLGHGHHHHNELLIAIVIHKVPIAIILGTFFVNSNFSKKTAVIFLVLFSLMSPLGSFAGTHIPFFAMYQTEITAIIIGVFLHISTVILFETSKDHTFNTMKFIALLFGMLVAVLA